MAMIPYFTRLKFAFRTFLSILDHSRIPDDILAALEPAATPASETLASDPAIPAAPVTAGPHAEDTRAVQILAILQRDGRLVDFLMEDLATYGDAQVGAAVRSVHANCRVALQRHLTLEPVVAETEGARVTVEAGTDPAMVKVVGRAAGRPPFQGIVRHRGWLLSRLDLPPAPPTDRYVIAPAEVEVP